jgi:hypothetical protein
VSRLRLIVVILATWLASVAVSPAVHAAPHIYYGPSGSRVLVDAFAFNDRSSSQVGSPSTSWVERSSAALGTASTRAHAFVATNNVRSLLEALPKGTGTKSDVRIVDTDADLQALFDVLSAGGAPLSRPTYDGQWYPLDDGCTVGLRNSSSSGGRTIDVKSPDGTTWKVHIA